MPESAAEKQGSRQGLGATMEIGRRASEQWMRGLFEAGEALGRFAMLRFNHDMDAWRALANCRNGGEVFACQCAFLEKAWADYSAEAARQFQFWSSLAEQALAIGRVPAGAAQPTEAKAWTVTRSAASSEPESATRRPAARQRSSAP